MLPSASDCVVIHFSADLGLYQLEYLSEETCGALAANGRIPPVSDTLDLIIALHGAYTVLSD